MKHSKHVTALFALLLSASALSGCTAAGVAAGTGATVGIAAAREGGVKNAVQDTTIRLNISDLWFKYDLQTFSRLNLIVEDGRVLITGVVDDADDRVEAVRLAWQVNGVTQVINEIQIKEQGRSLMTYAKDNWITTQLRAKITMDKLISSINYSIDTIEGVVYLIGVGQDQPEVDRVIDHARNIAGVTQVVNYVRLRGETPPNLRTPTDTPVGSTAKTTTTTTTTTRSVAPANQVYDNTMPMGGAGAGIAPVDAVEISPVE